MSKIPIHSFSATTGITNNDYFVILNGLIPKLLPKSSLNSIYAPSSSPVFTGTVSMPVPTNNNNQQAATTAWVTSRLNTGNIVSGSTSLDQALNTKVQLGGVLTGSISNPTLDSTGVTPGTYNFATVSVGADGRILSATSNTVAGGSVPSATSSTSGTVRVFANQTNPIVYLKDNVDNLFISRNTAASNITAVHSFNNGIKLGTTQLDIRADSPANKGYWFEEDYARAYSKLTNGVNIDICEKQIDFSRNQLSASDSHYFLPHTTSFSTDQSTIVWAYAAMFRYSGYTASNRWTMSLLYVSGTGTETTLLTRTLLPGSNPWTLTSENESYYILRMNGLTVRLDKIGNPGNLDIALSLQTRQSK